MYDDVRSLYCMIVKRQISELVRSMKELDEIDKERGSCMESVLKLISDWFDLEKLPNLEMKNG